MGYSTSDQQASYHHGSDQRGATAVLFALTFWRLGLNPELPAVLAFIFGGMLLAVIDWTVHRLPTRLAGTLAVVLFHA
jgi:hypothetical protein